MKKIAITILSVCLVVILCACGSNESAINGPKSNSVEDRYSYAQELLSIGKYSEAADVFDALGDYENSTKLALYARTAALGESGNIAIIDEEGDAIYLGLWEFTSERDEITITGYLGNEREIVIPSEIAGMPVTTIGTAAFEHSDFTSVVLPNGIRSIEEDAFEKCESLISINIPDGVSDIGHEAFKHCTALISLRLPDSVTNIGDGAFSACENLTLIFSRESYFAQIIFEYGISIPYSETDGVISVKLADVQMNNTRQW